MRDRKNWELYTDGACQPNPGVGGWAFILQRTRDGKEVVNNGWEADSTNNRMELSALMEGLEFFLSREECRGSICLYSDSKYLIDGLQKWLKKWIENDWKKTDGKPVINQDLWTMIHEMAASVDLTCVHVKGHTGNEGNERADRMAVEAVAKGKEQIQVSTSCGDTD